MKNSIKSQKANLILLSALTCILFYTSCSNTSTETKEASKKDVKPETVDSAAPANKDWIDIQATISNMDTTTRYEEIVSLLGKPYEEYITPSLKDEYIMLYDVPGVNGAYFWIMLDTQQKTFLFWSGEKNDK